MTARTEVGDLLEDGGVILADGATGTNFFKKGWRPATAGTLEC